MKVTITIHTTLGKFDSEEIDMSRQDYEKMIAVGSNYFLQDYKFNTQGGGSTHFSSEIMKESIIEFKIKKKHVAE